ncbi:thiolase family protein [Halobacteriovorax sp. XZX-3]|uniref:thiolase family protein n=1 Tax=unclassified Halobacteriovorax TaxID=2639665 RepID=UPI003713814D
MSLNKGRRVFLVGGKRTPFGKFGGSLMDIKPVDLAVAATNSLLSETGVKAELIDQVILGNVVPSSTDTMYGGRHLALKAGCAENTPGITINRLCGSGIQAILDAVRLIKLEEASCVLAGGTENMSMVPHLTYGSRFGTKYGSLKNVDMLLDALTDQHAGCPMGITAENLGSKYEVSRSDCDEFALLSHQRATAAYEDGKLQKEICEVEIRKGSVNKDEHLREGASLEDMNKLRSSFVKDGLVTAGSASGIVDGAAVALVASEDFVKEHGLKPIAEIIDGAVVGVDPTIMGIGPVPAIRKLLADNKMELDQIDLVEINEAFAAQALACMKELALDINKVNIWGGAIALGHPLAASGTRITTTLANQLASEGKEYGIASACIGGGQGIGILIKRV